MADEHGDVARHPILMTRVVSRDGTERIGLRVFCNERSSAVELDTCRECAVCVGIVAGRAGGTGGADDAEVWCRPRTVFGTGVPSELMQSPLTCVEADVPSSQITSLFVERSLDAVLVVDQRGRLTGSIRGSDLARAATAPLSHGVTPAIARAAERETADRFGKLRADALQASAVRINDGDDLDRAVRKLVHAHARELIVVTGDGEPVGILRDVDVMRAVVRRRQKSSNVSG